MRIFLIFIIMKFNETAVRIHLKFFSLSTYTLSNIWVQKDESKLSNSHIYYF
jgi:hypothetical protein